MPMRPIVLLHGYRERGENFTRWVDVLRAAGYDATTIHLGSYVSLSNELRIKDIAEGFDRALRASSTLAHGEPFDAIVHSTGMLVIREWLAGSIGTVDRPEVSLERQRRLKHLIGLAPATFGSPMAHKGRSWLGAMFKGERELGPDFMEAGDQVLAALELGSAYTWDLAHRDFLSEPAVYGRGGLTPYPFIFVGLDDEGWLERIVTEEGTDGTVRWSGVGFNSRKIRMDLTVEPSRRTRVDIQPWRNALVPQIFLQDVNHGRILTEPPAALVEMVLQALDVSSGAGYEAWAARHRPASAAALKSAKATRWQQFIVHAIDERGDGIADYFVQLGRVANRRFEPLRAFDVDVHAYREDESYRCFHVNLDELHGQKMETLSLRVIASSGTELVAYHGFNSSPNVDESDREWNKWNSVIEFDATIGGKKVQFFHPFTTTLVELRLNREPMPLTGINRVFWFLGP
jgi:hypothetical protein